MKVIAFCRVLICQVLFVMFFCVITHAQGQAAQYRQAAASYRDAAAKCSARRSCYLANADYYDCLANSLNTSSNARCTQPTCSLETPPCGKSETESGRVEPVNSTNNTGETINEMLDGVRDTILGIMESRARERDTREREAKERERIEAERVANEADAEMEAAAARRRARASEEESEEGERAKERQRLYKQQREREKVTASVQTSDVCGWKGLQWFGDKETVPTLEQLRKANGGAALSGDGAMILKIRTITKDGNITADINGSPVTGTINANRQIHLSGGDKQSTYYEIWGQFSTDGNVLTGKWKTEGYKVDISKPSRGIFALETECKK